MPANLTPEYKAGNFNLSHLFDTPISLVTEDGYYHAIPADTSARPAS